MPRTAIHLAQQKPIVINLSELEPLTKEVVSARTDITRIGTEIPPGFNGRINTLSGNIDAVKNKVDNFPETLTSTVNVPLSDHISTLSTYIKDEVKKGLLEDQLLPLVKQILKTVKADDEDGIDLDNVSETCIEEAFIFLRLLNQVEDLTIDQKFCEPNKNNNSLLAKYKTQKPYKDCQSILQNKVKDGQLSESVIATFDALFKTIDSSLKGREGREGRAERWLKIQSFRRQVIDLFLSEDCQDELITPESASDEPAKAQGATPPDSPAVVN